MAQVKDPLKDPLISELAGDPVVVTAYPDGAPPDLTGIDDPLEVKAKLNPSPVNKMDAVHSTAAGGKGYRVKVRGEYFAQSKEVNVKIRRPYELDFNLPSLEGALGTIVGKLLTPALRKKYDDFSTFRTHEIVDVKPLSAHTPESNNLQYMSREKLEAHVRDNRIPLNPVDYPDALHLRSAVIDYTNNPKGFEVREAKRQAERQEVAELAALNPDFEVTAPQ